MARGLGGVGGDYSREAINRWTAIIPGSTVHGLSPCYLTTSFPGILRLTLGLSGKGPGNKVGFRQSGFFKKGMKDSEHTSLWKTVL